MTKFVSTSHIVYVDFQKKTIVDEQILFFDKMDLLREGLINYERLLRRGFHVSVIKAEAS